MWYEISCLWQQWLYLCFMVPCHHGIVDRQEDGQGNSENVCTCRPTAVSMLHEDLIHVQHNDGTGACINMSLASSLWGHTQDPMTAHVHIHTRSYWLCNYSGKRSYSGPTDKHIVQTSWETTTMIQTVCYYSDRWLMHTCHHEHRYQHHHRRQMGKEEKDLPGNPQETFPPTYYQEIEQVYKDAQTTNHWPHTQTVFFNVGRANKITSVWFLTKLIHKCT